MTTPSKQDIASLKGSGLFDAERYRSTYPDVDILGMDPTEHYLKYGRPLGRMPADVEMVDISLLDKLESLPAPKPGSALLEAHEICRAGNDALGLAYAKKHTSVDMTYTIQTLRANAALRRGDEAGWLRHLNAYLGNFNVAPVRLGGGATIFDRFTTATLPAVTEGPLISIIMTVYNAEKSVFAAVKSLINQTYRNIEILLVDDKSDDCTWQRMVKLASSDRRVRIYRNSINIGTYASKNIGLHLTNGEWITCHDADDWAHPKWIESHFDFISRCAEKPRVSHAMMLRITEDGFIDRFVPVGPSSIDGAARDCLISCFFERAFILHTLGGWDNVRYGADSELIERAKIILGEEYNRAPIFGMLCMVSPSSLTSQPEHFIDRISGPSAKPREYVASYRKWHDDFKANPDSFPAIDASSPSHERLFPAPSSFVVDQVSIMLNRASILGDSEIEKTKVSLVCVSKRPWFLPVVAAMIEAQIHENIELVFVAHGDAFKGVDVEGILNRIRSVSVIRLGEDVLFGDALNEAVSRCSADLVTKIDDDDFYGPNYISRSIAAMMYNGFEEVAAVGKGRAFIYAGGINFFGVRFPKANENCLRKHVFGGTLFWSQIKTGFQKFRSVSSAVDTGFLEDIIAKGCQVYSSDRFDHILFRHRGEGHHTWRISDEDFVRPAQKIGSSLEVASACSSFDYAALEGLQRKILSASVKSYDGEPSDKSIKSLK